MNIKEIEQRSGMNRANIRFYEQEGLLAPRRLDNGYRDYSEDDLQQLHRIHLLRTLGLSLDEIRAAQKGEQTLDKLLEEKATALERQATESQRRAHLCRDICRSGAQYSTLDGQRWLESLTAAEPAASAVPQTDTYHKVTAPWRRFFAFLLDDYFYTSLWVIFGLLVIHKSPASDTGAAWTAAAGIMSILLMLFLEPLFLSTWGTTPGKWLLGLSVRNNTGQKLSYGEGFYRTVQVLWYGLGFWLPIYSLIRGYKSYYDCKEGKTLEWEWDSELQLKDEEPWRAIAVVAAVTVLLLSRAGAAKLSYQPLHRGDITVAEFAQNYNRTAAYHDYASRLDADGTWREENGGYFISLSDIEAPDFTYTERDGIMTGLSFHVNVENDAESCVPSFATRRSLAIHSFVQAHAPFLRNDEVDALLQRISDAPFESFDTTLHGIRIVCHLTYSGYYEGMLGDMLVPIEGQSSSCSLVFTMEKVS